jgi:hypothetical protein
MATPSAMTCTKYLFTQHVLHSGGSGLQKKLQTKSTTTMETIVQNAWSKAKPLFKSFTIAALILLLLIPTHYVKNLIEEREQRQKEAISEVSRYAADQSANKHRDDQLRLIIIADVKYCRVQQVCQ